IYVSGSIPSSRRKYTRPDSSPATIVNPSGVIAQDVIELSPVKLAMTFPLNKSQTLRVLSDEPEIARLPSAVTATAYTELLWPSRVNCSFRVVKSQTLSVLSFEPEIARLPSAVTATVYTELL